MPSFHEETAIGRFWGGWFNCGSLDCSQLSANTLSPFCHPHYWKP